MIFTSVRNGGQLFIPVAGVYTNGSVIEDSESIYIWSCILSSGIKSNAQVLHIDRSPSTEIFEGERCAGLIVRPVLGYNFS